MILSIPAEARIASSNPAVYAAQLILWILQHSGGQCEQQRLSMAISLLSKPWWMVELAPCAIQEVAWQWLDSFNETGYEKLFHKALTSMLGAEVVLRREGETVYVDLAQPERLLDRPWIAFDARLALAVLDRCWNYPARICT